MLNREQISNVASEFGIQPSELDERFYNFAYKIIDLHSSKSDFHFISMLSKLIKEISWEHRGKLYTKDWCEKTGMSLTEFSAIRADRTLITDEQANALSKVFKEYGYECTIDQLKGMQKVGCFIENIDIERLLFPNDTE